jgi:hypothetical protein
VVLALSIGGLVLLWGVLFYLAGKAEIAMRKRRRRTRG